jgi:uncharacterized protein YkwD
MNTKQMSPFKCKTLAFDALQKQGSEAYDNLNRAKANFRDKTFTQMQEKFGLSGRTCQEILDGYQEQVDAVKAVIDWLNSVPA